MVTRVWRGWAPAATAERYERHYRTEVLESLQGVAGFRGARLLRRTLGGEVEFVSLTFFDDLDAVRAFAGADCETAVVAGPAQEVLSRYDRTVAHYDTAFEYDGDGSGGDSDDMDETDDYDEFGLLHENAAEWVIPFDGAPAVGRHTVELAGGQRLSYVRWGTDTPEYAFLHGGGQNAHTWDTVLLALGRPALAFDLPGHGHSDRRDDKDYGPWRNAEAVTEALDALAPGGLTVVGMSLGGATTIRLAAERPDLCRQAVIVDVTPGVNDPNRQLTKDHGSVALIAGPPTYDSFEEMADAAVALNPRRSPAGVRRGVRHNAHRLPDGRWAWRYDLFGLWPEEARKALDFARLWDDVEAITVPTLFVRGELSPFVSEEAGAEMGRRLPGVRAETVAGAGHAVQSDRPLDLVRLIESFGSPGRA